MCRFKNLLMSRDGSVGVLTTFNMASHGSWLFCLRTLSLSIFFDCTYCHFHRVLGNDVDSCKSLRLGQYLCKEPWIDDATQEPANCKDMIAWVECLPAPNVSCRLSNGTEFRFSGEEVGFNQSIPCRNVSGYSYKIAVALSLFLGWLGADRFYLGYPALGLLKFCTVGFCGIGSLVDFMLISMQIVGPSDKSDYIVDYYGARLTRLSITNDTYRRTQISP
ncbi:TM2 domain-containing protein 1 isoform X1 [Oncorhynchus mykiss]|uniref:TM2 domain containing 1 n=1 Tax=Oncorhynchus mykiss TaxID=8022 RepID=A0A8C7VSX2_ONCMY|nr:TM2 domain-containing protein 1 isoform X1 [Oncorhynchus mykiss]XP_021459067.1 TM2 domain-containing protein 1 isoform X1 [Oncorhynchus mykiss]XP_021459068.1 TM2 domain-containing protein 1 isoform X1 [Oncorhynchus mykiss]